MSTLTISALLAGMIAAAVPAVPATAVSAELLPPAVAQLRHHHHAAPYCGSCGCLHVSYVYHKVLQSTYGLSFDPRNFDQTEPRYHFGPARAYPRYWVDADPMQ